MGRVYAQNESSAAGLQEARKRTAAMKRQQKEQFEQDVREADKVRARAILQNLESRKLISSVKRVGSKGSRG